MSSCTCLCRAFWEEKGTFKGADGSLDDVVMIVKLLQEHDLPKRALQPSKDNLRLLKGSMLCAHSPANCCLWLLALQGCAAGPSTGLCKRIAYLSIGGVLKGVKDLLQSSSLSALLFDCLPDDTICLR